MKSIKIICSICAISSIFCLNGYSEENSPTTPVGEKSFFDTEFDTEQDPSNPGVGETDPSRLEENHQSNLNLGSQPKKASPTPDNGWNRFLKGTVE